MRSRDWPPDEPPQPPKPAPPTPPRRHVLVMLEMMVALVFGSPLVAWVVLALPGEHPFAPTIVPLAWLAALLVFLTGSYFDIRRRK